ncbi:MAG: hypothetical protein ACLU77_08315 [Waltera sp.]
MDLFEYMRSTNMEKEAPLAARMRPRTLDEVVGQEHIIGKDKLLYRAIKADKIKLHHLYGPPGNRQDDAGESRLPIRQVQNFTRSMPRWRARRIWKKWWQKAKETAGHVSGSSTILFVDEIHRFNKGQQDYLLPVCGGRNDHSR